MGVGYFGVYSFLMLYMFETVLCVTWSFNFPEGRWWRWCYSLGSLPSKRPLIETVFPTFYSFDGECETTELLDVRTVFSCVAA